MVSLTELFQSMADSVVGFLEASELYEYVLPFLLVWILVYAILQKVNLFGERSRGFNIVIGLVIGMLLARQGDLVEFINTYLPNVSAIVVVFLGFLILLGMFGFSSKNFTGGIMILFVLIALGGGIWALVQTTQQEEISYTLFGNEIEIREGDAGLLFMLGVIIIIVAVAFRKPKKNVWDGLLDGMSKVGNTLGQPPQTPST